VKREFRSRAKIADHQAHSNVMADRPERSEGVSARRLTSPTGHDEIF